MINELEIKKRALLEVVTSIDGLVAWYRCNGNGLDEVGGNNISLSGTANFNGVSYNNSSCYANAGTSGFGLSGSTFNLPIAQSWSFWVRINSLSALQFLLGNVAFRASNIAFRVDTNSNMSVQLEYPGDSGTVLISSIATNTWYHVSATISSTRFLRVYLNGNQTNTFQIPVGWVTSPMALLLGKYITTSNSYNINGLVDNIRIYNRELTSSEILKIYQTENL